MSFDFSILEKYWQLILSGVPIILYLSLGSAFFGSLIGLISVFIRKSSKIGNAVIATYVDLFRGTPVFVQLFLFYFGLPSLIPALGNISPVVSCYVVFSLNSGSYLSEIMRAGIEGIDKGQIEAAKALGVNSKDIAFDIIIPQAIRNVLPAIVNEFITLTKETSIVSLVGLHDMMYWYTSVKNQTFSNFEPLIIVFFAYYFMNKALSLLGKFVERKLSYD
ncbi:MAG: amino acid ABC transporter permease [Erysipelotrichia bacterium]|nr:amino acid ABC transporter permease [Erysipelotrichia bacterium]NCC54674.1 amino acid ABC transporter permease [Erysipelotrichia bacterium]